MKCNEIRAVYSQDTIRIYQAYSAKIANEAVTMGKFGSKFKMDRMTWIKPSFLWMMYRSDWGEKEDQEHILAIDLKREGFDYAVRNAVLTTYQKDVYSSYEDWKHQIMVSDIRCQWDPERDIYGNALNCRTIQIGLKGRVLEKYVKEWIVNIADITKYTYRLKEMRDRQLDISELLPNERIYQIS